MLVRVKDLKFCLHFSLIILVLSIPFKKMTAQQISESLLQYMSKIVRKIYHNICLKVMRQTKYLAIEKDSIFIQCKI